MIYVTQIVNKGSPMNFDKIKAAAGGDTNNSETIAFRLRPDTKQALLDICDREQLSLGKLFREMAEEFVRHAD